MTINLYINNSDPKTVSKSLTGDLTFEGVARDPLDVVNPVIELQADITMLQGYNYAYIPEYHRYYFMEPQGDSYGLNTLRLRCDPLMTAAPYLRARNATITKNEKLYSAYLADPDFKSYAFTNIVTKKFPYGIQGDSIILMTVG